jgi:hypothetical protein
MIWALAAGLVAYSAAGVSLARWDRPAAWARARKDWHFEDSQRGSVRTQLICMLLFWPLLITVRMVLRKLDAFADAGDPRALREALAARDRRVRELERELGIGKPS